MLDFLPKRITITGLARPAENRHPIFFVATGHSESPHLQSCNGMDAVERNGYELILSCLFA